MSPCSRLRIAVRTASRSRATGISILSGRPRDIPIRALNLPAFCVEIPAGPRRRVYFRPVLRVHRFGTTTSLVPRSHYLATVAFSASSLFVLYCRCYRTDFFSGVFARRAPPPALLPCSLACVDPPPPTNAAVVVAGSYLLRPSQEPILVPSLEVTVERRSRAGVGPNTLPASCSDGRSSYGAHGAGF